MTITLVLGSGGTIGGDTEETYVLTIPESLTITQDGWNAFSGGIHAEANSEASSAFSGTLTVTASSDNNWSLVLSPDKSDSVSYTLASQDNGAQNLTWTFTATEVNADGGTSKDAGVILGSHTGKTAGTYVDMITFTASVEEKSTGLSGTIVVSGYYNNQYNAFSATATLENETLSVKSTSGVGSSSINSISLTYSDGKLTIDMAKSTASKTVTVDLSTGEYTQTTSGNADVAGRINLTEITLNGSAKTLTSAS